MPNRLIKESICTSDTVDGLSWFEEVVFYRLIVNCDDYGRFDGRLPVIKNKLFPLKENITSKSVADAIHKLSTVGLVTLYEYEGKPYLQLVTWSKHQQVRAKKSKYPAFDGSCSHLISDDIKCPRNPIQSESNPNPNPIQIQSNPIQTKEGSEPGTESEGENSLTRPEGKARKKTKAEESYGQNLDVLETLGLSEDVHSLLASWCRYKLERGEAYVETGFRTFVGRVQKQIAANGIEAVAEVIELTMSNGWQGVVWDKIRAGPTAPPEPIIHEAPPEWKYDPDKDFLDMLGVEF